MMKENFHSEIEPFGIGTACQTNVKAAFLKRTKQLKTRLPTYDSEIF